MAHYNTESLCVHCKNLRPALDPNLQKAFLGKCVKREWPFTLSLSLQGWMECHLFENSGKAYVPPEPLAAAAKVASVPPKGPRRLEFYYSSKHKPGEMFPCNIDQCLRHVRELQAAGVECKVVDVSQVKDRFPIYHKAVSGPDATVRPVFGAKGALVDDFGTTVPALLVFDGDRYPTFAFPRSDAKTGFIGVEKALENQLAECKVPAMAVAG